MESERRKNTLTGVVVSASVSGLLLIVLLVVKLSPPSPASLFAGVLELLDLKEVPEQPIEVPRKPPNVVARGGEGGAGASNNDVGKPIEVAPSYVELSDKTRDTRPDNRPDAKPSTAGDHGDVERYEPPENRLNPQALFQSNNNGTSELDNRTNVKGDNTGFFPGTGTSDVATRGPNAIPGSFIQQKGVDFSLAGRSGFGKWPLPEYNVQKEGKVVVEITVDKQGKVVRAIGGVKGSTTADADLIRAAEEAAKKATFNVDLNASLQTGTITYIFRLE